MNIVANTGNFVHEHPVASVGVGVGIVLLLWWISSGSKSTVTATAPYNSTADAAAIAQSQIAANTAVQNTQIQANAAVSQAQIAAGVANQASADQLAATIASFNAGLSAQQSHDAAMVATANASTEQTRITEASAVTQNYNNNIAGEFATLAQTILSYGMNAQNITGGIQSQQVSAQSEYDKAKLAADYSPNTIWNNFGNLGSIGTNYLAKILGVATTPTTPPGSNAATTPAVSGGNPSNYESAGSLSLLNRLTDKIGVLMPAAPASVQTSSGSGATTVNTTL